MCFVVGAWLDAWSTRWNPALFAEQGYIVACPNPTGSTSYGQALTDAITEDWGGAPYIDLESGLDHLLDTSAPYAEHVASTFPLSANIDPNRLVALGASYGGYKINYMQGQPLGKRFAALVCHDGVFSLPASQSATDELYFPNHDFGGPFCAPPSSDSIPSQHHGVLHTTITPNIRPIYDKFDPARYTHLWTTPQLTIHSSKDYRLSISEGLAVFNTLQMRGVESMFLTFPDENHWVLKPENSLVWHRVVLGWINRFVGLGKVLDGEGRDVLEGYLSSRRTTDGGSGSQNGNSV